MSDAPWRLFDCTVAEVHHRTPNLRRVVFEGVDLGGMADPGTDTRIKLLVAADADRSAEAYRSMDPGPGSMAQLRALPAGLTMRTYTLAAWRATATGAKVAVDFALHDQAVAGPATRWAAQARPGQAMRLVGPVRTFDGEVGGREFQAAHVGREQLLLVADHCALPALERILAELPPHATGVAVIECPSPADRLELPRPEGIEVRWLHGARGSIPVIAELEDWGRDGTTPDGGDHEADNPDVFWEVQEAEVSCAWVAAEASVARDVRRFVVGEKGLDKRSVAFMGYWRRGRSES
ncbi:siderophore-interacting protein [Tessaracoccus sp. ZS01]|uniref:siderophore-interacting protein n=1 Tax=Tessaracoccus sp. ZS01 TaxID=1906324 RepID=UPI00096F69C5|nr:siderophore-interacting protein [Tessaracoccus sp. ZS01]MCG6566080.1 siderophore-interacting protein [Tessaracoccus sp. ZS01]OMG58585.1 hypothetical protein BJN44_00320 [Tessaracoccus sp. ZS01]